MESLLEFIIVEVFVYVDDSENSGLVLTSVTWNSFDVLGDDLICENVIAFLGMLFSGSLGKPLDLEYAEELVVDVGVCVLLHLCCD